MTLFKKNDETLNGFTETHNPYQNQVLAISGIDIDGNLLPYMGVTLQSVFSDVTDVRNVVLPGNINKADFKTFLGVVTFIFKYMKAQNIPLKDMVGVLKPPFYSLKDKKINSHAFGKLMIEHLSNLDKQTLVALSMTANFLDHILVLDWVMAYITDMHIRGRSVEYMREYFNLPSDGAWNANSETKALHAKMKLETQIMEMWMLQDDEEKE